MKMCHMQSQAIDNIMKTIGSGRSRGGPGAYHLPILDSMNFFSRKLDLFVSDSRDDFPMYCKQMNKRIIAAVFVNVVDVDVVGLAREAKSHLEMWSYLRYKYIH